MPKARFLSWWLIVRIALRCSYSVMGTLSFFYQSLFSSWSVSASPASTMHCYCVHHSLVCYLVSVLFPDSSIHLRFISLSSPSLLLHGSGSHLSLTAEAHSSPSSKSFWRYPGFLQLCLLEFQYLVQSLSWIFFWVSSVMIVVILHLDHARSPPSPPSWVRQHGQDW